MIVVYNPTGTIARLSSGTVITPHTWREVPESEAADLLERGRLIQKMIETPTVEAPSVVAEEPQDGPENTSVSEPEQAVEQDQDPEPPAENTRRQRTKRNRRYATVTNSGDGAFEVATMSEAGSSSRTEQEQ